MASSRAERAGWSKSRVWGIGIVVALALSVGVGFEVWLDADDVDAEEARTRELGVALASALLTPVESLHAVVALLETPKNRLSLAEFRTFCRPALDRHPEMVALEWFPLVMREERVEFERWARREQPGFRMVELSGETMVVAADRSSHLPLIYAEPAASGVMGLDLTFEAVRAEPAWRALNLGRATSSDRFRLVEDPADVYSVVAYAPVDDAHWVDAEDPAGRQFRRGVAVALFRLDNLVVAALSGHDTSDLGLTLTDLDAPEPLKALFSAGPRLGERVRTTTVPFIDRTYRLSAYFRPGPFLHSAALTACLGALGLGLLALELFLARRREGILSKRLESLGQYRLESLIGSGGMGRVYRAKHAVLRRPTAIKIALPGSSIERFEREARLHASLTHPNTVTVYDYGRGEGGTFYVAMDYIQGYDLWALVRRTGRLPAARAINILIQAAAALEEAHATGVVHRDIKPSNIMVTARGGLYDFVKVLDFGLARSWDPSEGGTSSTLPQGPTAFAGTPGYAAPEVVSGEPATVASDVFSLGAVGYFLLEGIGPFAAPTSVGALTRTLARDVSPMTMEVPAQLRQLVGDCLAYEPDRRPTSMAELGRGLREIQAELPSFSEAEAEAWWREHPPGEGEPLAGRRFSLVFREGRSDLTSSSGGDTET